MSWKRRKRLCEQRAEKQKTMRQMLELSEKEDRELTSEEASKFDDLSTESDTLTQEIARFDRMAEIEAEQREEPQPGRDDPNAPGPEQRDTTEQREERRQEAFDAFLRHGQDGLRPEHREILNPRNASEIVGAEERAMSVSGFGVVGTRGFSGQLVDAMKHFAGVREAGATVLRASTGNPFGIPTADDTGEVGQLLDENEEETNDDTTPTPGNVSLAPKKFSSKYIRLSLELIQDSEFDVEAYVREKAGERIGRIFNTYSTNGNGTTQPQGFTIAAAANNVETVKPAAISFDDLLNLMGKVDAAYWRLPSAGWQFHQQTLIDVRKLKDDNGRPIWTPAFNSEPERIHGYRLTLNNDLDAIADAEDNEALAAWGAWAKYVVRDVTQTVLIRDPFTFAKYGQVAFLVFSRHDGKLTDPKAVSLLTKKAAA